MEDDQKSKAELLAEIQALRDRLSTSEETLRAIQQGEVDALVVSTPQGEKLFTLQSADYSYRLLVEQMQQGAVILSSEGLILYSNKSLANLLQQPLEKLIGSDFQRFISPQDIPLFQALVQQAEQGERNSVELFLNAHDAVEVPVYLSINYLSLGESAINCIVITDLTTQKRHEKTLAAERLARLILEQAGEAILVTDQKGQIIRASQIACQLWGENLLLQPFDARCPLYLCQSKFSAPTTQDVAIARNNVESASSLKVPFSIASVINGESYQWLEVEFERQDGQVFNLVLNARPLTDQENHFRGAVVILTDITAIKQAEAELKQAKEELEIRVAERTAELSKINADLQRSESTLRSFFNSGSMLMGIVELHNNDILHISDNQAAAEFFGTTPEAMQNRFASDLGVPKLIIQEWMSYYRQAEQIQAPVQFEYPHETANDQEYLSVSVCPIAVSPNGYPRFSYIVEDISERKRIEDALRESEEKFRQLAENIQAVFWMTDIHNQQILYVSKAYETIWQRSREDVYQNFSACLDAIHPDDRQLVDMAFTEQLKTGQSDTKYRIIRPDGSMRWIRDRAFPIKNELGEIIRIAGIAEDITELQKVEQIKSEFIGIVSHELRTPLTSIRASMGLLNSGIYDQKPDKFKRMIEIAAIESERLVRLVNDILDLERLESGRSVLEKTTCEVADLIEQAVESVKAIAKQEHITLIQHPTNAKVWAAADAIIQTLTNLLSNAIKFSPPNSTITLSVQPQSDRVLFQISDQGRGIPAEKLELIFGRFHQVDATDSRDKGGTGLGLAICRSIIEQHGGQIWAQSTLGVGSTFFFTLPLPSGEQGP